MVAFTRIANESILERGLIASPDIVVNADETLLEDAQARPLQGLAAAGHVLMNFKSPNEAYGNTGMQQSSATPYAARTATTASGAGLGEDVPRVKKDIFEIWRAHTPPYLATVSARYPVDLARRFEKSKQIKRPKLFVAFAPCPTGWLCNPAETQEYGRLGVECGIFPLKEAVHCEVTHTYVKRRWWPVGEYQRGQGRFRHLFEPVRQGSVIRTMQEAVDRYGVRVKA
jgi:pyruvate ferredoxin oxidoreductase beta subunit